VLASFQVMRFIRDALITIAVLVAIVSIVLYTQVRAGGLAADAEPGHAERLIASRLVRLAIPADARQQQNPLSGDDKTIWRTAADHYGDHCAACHGNDGRGDTELGRNMYPGVPSFADETVQRLSDGELFYIIQNGVRWTGMPAWKDEHSADDSWRLVSLIRAMPTLTPADLDSAGLGAASDEKGHHHHEREGGDDHPALGR
jgi:mono/diheme cytochrome c family protein